jgi:hypothetical protein
VINELAGVISISNVVYGSTHEKFALAHINLAQAYLEMKNLPKQAKKHCETAWNILLENLKENAKRSVQREQHEASKVVEAIAKSQAEEKDAADADGVVTGSKTKIEPVDEEKPAEETIAVVEKKPYIYPDSEKHQMMLNYIYGRSCTILRE